jgi:hypothetical protein
MMISYKYALYSLVSGLLVQSCATVGKEKPFEEFNKEVAALKTDTASAMDLTKLNFSEQLKTETIATAESTAVITMAADQAGKDLENAHKTLANASKQLTDALEDPKTDEPTKKRLTLAIHEAEAAIPKAEGKVKVTGKQAEAALELLNKKVDSFDIRVSGGDPLDWGASNTKPSYFELIRMREKAIRCVEVVEDYSKLLAELATPGLLDEGRFQKTAEQLNASAASLFRKSGDASALISTAAVYSARVYIQNRQAKDLQKAITVNQPNIERFTKLMEDGIILFVRNADNFYSKELRAAQKISVPGDDGKAGRAAAAASLVSTNEMYITLLDSMKKLRERYRKLPANHLTLAQTVVSPSASLAYIERASGVAAGIGSQYERGVAQNKYQDALLTAKSADELAVSFERRATAAEAETNLVKSKADIAQAISERDPADQANKDEAFRLKQEHLELKVKSDELRAQASYYRSLANIAKGDADRLKPATDTAPANKAE